MKHTFIVLIMLLLTSCASVEEKQNIKMTSCELLGQTASMATAIKWTSRETAPSGEEKSLRGWQYIAFVSSESLSKLGLTMQEIEDFSQEIFETDIVPKMEYDMLSFSYYKQKQCELMNARVSTQPLKHIKVEIHNCWLKEQTSLTPRACIEKVVADEA